MKNIQQDKELFLEQIKKIPVIQIACEKLGSSRATFYRWKSQDQEFAKKIDEAIIEGRLMVNDLAEANLISAIKDKNIPAITYWLKHHHKDYINKLEINGRLKTDIGELSEEQQDNIRKALKLASIYDTSQNQKHE